MAYYILKLARITKYMLFAEKATAKADNLGMNGGTKHQKKIFGVGILLGYFMYFFYVRAGAILKGKILIFVCAVKKDLLNLTFNTVRSHKHLDR